MIRAVPSGAEKTSAAPSVVSFPFAHICHNDNSGTSRKTCHAPTHYDRMPQLPWCNVGPFGGTPVDSVRPCCVASSSTFRFDSPRCVLKAAPKRRASGAAGARAGAWPALGLRSSGS